MDSVASGKFNYYVLGANEGNSLTFTLNITTPKSPGQGLFALYISKSADQPTIFEYDYAATSQTQPLIYSINEVNSNAWTLGVYGWDDSPLQYTLSATDSCK